MVFGYLDPWDSVRLRTASTHWHVQKECGPHCELFFFFLKKGPMVLSKLVELGPCASATVKACALIGMHMMAEENAFRLANAVSPHFWRLVEVWLHQKALVGAAAALNGQEVRVLLWSTMSSTSILSLLKSLGKFGQVK